MKALRTTTRSAAFAAALAAVLGSAAVAPTHAQDAGEPLIGTIRYFAFNFPPRGWSHCDGQLVAISENNALFALLGTIYGGDGRTTFKLPDMRGRFPVHQGQGPGLTSRRIGAAGGEEVVTLTAGQIEHVHLAQANIDAGAQTSPAGHVLAANAGDMPYHSAPPDVAMMAAGSIGSQTDPTAGGQAHDNMPPFLGAYCNISLFGLFPSRQ